MQHLGLNAYSANMKIFIHFAFKNPAFYFCWQKSRLSLENHTQSSVQLYCNGVIDAVLMQGFFTWLRKLEQETEYLLRVHICNNVHRKLRNLVSISKNDWWLYDSMHQFCKCYCKTKISHPFFFFFFFWVSQKLDVLFMSSIGSIYGMTDLTETFHWDMYYQPLSALL